MGGPDGSVALGWNIPDEAPVADCHSCCCPPMVRQQARYHGYYDWLTDYGDAAMVTPPVSGTYYIDACGYDRQFGDYSVTVRLQTVVNADTIAELTTDVPFIEVEGSVS